MQMNGGAPLTPIDQFDDFLRLPPFLHSYSQPKVVSWSGGQWEIVGEDRCVGAPVVSSHVARAVQAGFCRCHLESKRERCGGEGRK